MPWIPTIAKIIDFGTAWIDNMLIPDTTDPVLGEDDPGGTPIAIGVMGSASGLAFAYLSNNLQYLRDVFVFEDLALAASNVTELQAALDILDRIQYVQKGATVTLTIAAGSYSWPASGSESRSAIDLRRIAGRGTVEVNTNGAIISGACTINRPLVTISGCECTVNITQALILENTAAAGIQVVSITGSRYVNMTVLDVRNNSGDTVGTAVYCQRVDYLQLGLTIDTPAPTNSGVGTGLYATGGSNVYCALNKLTLKKLVQRLVFLSQSSQLFLNRFEDMIPAGADMVDLTARGVVNISASSRIVADALSGSGAGTRASPYVITVAWESGTLTALKVQNIIDALPRPLDLWVKIKYPAGTITEPLFIEDMDGDGGIMLEANTATVVIGVAQDTIYDCDDDAIVIDRVKVPVIVGSIRCDNNTGRGAIAVINSRNVEIWYGYLIAATGTGSAGFGNGLYAKGADTQVFLHQNKIGACNQDGIYAINGATVHAPINNEVDSGANRPQQNGNNAELAGVIKRSINSGQFITGAVAIDAKDTGGQVWSS